MNFLNRTLICIAILMAGIQTSQANISLPAKYNKLPNMELGNFIHTIMPDKNLGINSSAPLEWTYLADSKNIVWLTDGYTIDLERKIQYRKGITKINVLGKSPAHLFQGLTNYPWSIVYVQDASFGEMPSKFGFKQIRLIPESPTAELSGNACFGGMDTNCDFSPLPSLNKRGIAYKAMCENILSASNFSKIYLLSVKDKTNLYMEWFKSEGSGGSLTWLYFSNLKPNLDTCEFPF